MVSVFHREFFRSDPHPLFLIPSSPPRSVGRDPAHRVPRHLKIGSVQVQRLFVNVCLHRCCVQRSPRPSDDGRCLFACVSSRSLSRDPEDIRVFRLHPEIPSRCMYLWTDAQNPSFMWWHATLPPGVAAIPRPGTVGVHTFSPRLSLFSLLVGSVFVSASTPRCL